MPITSVEALYSLVATDIVVCSRM